MNFFELLTIGMVLSLTGFTVRTFFSYLRFRRTNSVGKGSQADIEELAQAFQHYMRQTSKRLENLETIHANQIEQQVEQPYLNEAEIMNTKNGAFKNHLDRSLE
jgi:hypothetical protein